MEHIDADDSLGKDFPCNRDEVINLGLTRGHPPRKNRRTPEKKVESPRDKGEPQRWKTNHYLRIQYIMLYITD